MQRTQTALPAAIAVINVAVEPSYAKEGASGTTKEIFVPHEVRSDYSGHEVIVEKDITEMLHNDSAQRSASAAPNTAPTLVEHEEDISHDGPFETIDLSEALSPSPHPSPAKTYPSFWFISAPAQSTPTPLSEVSRDVVDALPEPVANTATPDIDEGDSYDGILELFETVSEGAVVLHDTSSPNTMVVESVVVADAAEEHSEDTVADIHGAVGDVPEASVEDDMTPAPIQLNNGVPENMLPIASPIAMVVASTPTQYFDAAAIEVSPKSPCMALVPFRRTTQPLQVEISRFFARSTIAPPTTHATRPYMRPIAGLSTYHVPPRAITSATGQHFTTVINIITGVHNHGAGSISILPPMTHARQHQARSIVGLLAYHAIPPAATSSMHASQHSTQFIDIIPTSMDVRQAGNISILPRTRRAGQHFEHSIASLLAYYGIPSTATSSMHASGDYIPFVNIINNTHGRKAGSISIHLVRQAMGEDEDDVVDLGARLEEIVDDDEDEVVCFGRRLEELMGEGGCKEEKDEEEDEEEDYLVEGDTTLYEESASADGMQSSDKLEEPAIVAADDEPFENLFDGANVMDDMLVSLPSIPSLDDLEHENILTSSMSACATGTDESQWNEEGRPLLKGGNTNASTPTRNNHHDNVGSPRSSLTSMAGSTPSTSTVREQQRRSADATATRNKSSPSLPKSRIPLPTRRTYPRNASTTAPSSGSGDYHRKGIGSQRRARSVAPEGRASELPVPDLSLIPPTPPTPSAPPSPPTPPELLSPPPEPPTLPPDSPPTPPSSLPPAPMPPSPPCDSPPTPPWLLSPVPTPPTVPAPLLVRGSINRVGMADVIRTEAAARIHTYVAIRLQSSPTLSSGLGRPPTAAPFPSSSSVAPRRKRSPPPPAVPDSPPTPPSALPPVPAPPVPPSGSSIRMLDSPPTPPSALPPVPTPPIVPPPLSIRPGAIRVPGLGITTTMKESSPSTLSGVPAYCPPASTAEPITTSSQSVTATSSLSGTSRVSKLLTRIGRTVIPAATTTYSAPQHTADRAASWRGGGQVPVACQKVQPIRWRP
ncbi:hypothetical protein OE88DRAFT_1243933 [Heliocybe sulcata]|uniref:Uncharacterized protein n=1 Tax=Heliocybe sulcata TaxID=5364 RepID=A0A5C3N7R7_9AGAM|nr:hypothetical protein OE88DRAFT_1243933 [Heliocybe sulcata]